MAPNKGRKKGKTSASRPKAPRKYTENDPEYYNIKFYQEEHRLEWDRLVKVPMRPTKYVNEDTIKDLGIHDDVLKLFDRVGWLHLMTLCRPTYRNLTLEFLSTLIVTKSSSSRPLKIEFQLGNEERELIAKEFNSIFQIPQGGVQSTILTGDMNQFWKEISGEPSFDPSRSKASAIRNPVFRVIRAILASSIFARENKSGLRRIELCALYCMATISNMDLGSYIIDHLESQTIVEEKSIIGIDGIVTALADHFGVRYINRPALLGIMDMDMVQLRTMHIIKGDGPFILLQK